MRALRYHGNKDIRLDDVPEPECKPGWIKLRCGYTGICGTDLHEYTTGPSWVPTTPHCLTGAKLPCTLGHEFAGTIVEVGEGLSDFKVGQKAAIEPCISDTTCADCKEGFPVLCEKLGVVGFSGWDGGGGLSEYICLPPRNVHPVPDSMSLEVAALIEPLNVPWRAIKASGFKFGETALVLGLGPIGLMTILCLQAFGASKIIVSDPAEGRLELARKLGAHHVFDPKKDDVESSSKDLCDGRGPHVVFECAGVQASLTTALAAVRKRGTVIGLALWETQATIDPNDVVLRQVKYFGILPYVPGDFQEVINAVTEGRIHRPERLISAKIAVEDIVSKGFDALLNNKSDTIKVLVKPLSGEVDE
ncbi:chaperonin 10-like protein [Exophiala viscosa]|uniref:chaperonin 10-like protein n=1 Tax=Exophiala viscosa TaxID=2486360 RepID=UPI0021A1BCE5|nr:chaperonin 10-like protein [Exophiala viscosa]